MLDFARQWHGDTILGIALLGFVAYSLWSDWRFRSSALRVPGEVRKFIRYSKHISYYIAYQVEGATRVAEFYGPGPIAIYNVGDTLDILIDPKVLPDVRIPEGTHIRWSRAGNCIPAGGSVVSVFEILLVALGLFLLVHGV